MTELLHGIETPSDAELISRVRGGDLAAYGDLFERHVDAARRLSRQLVRGPDADDLVSEAFTKVMAVLQNGGGPDVAFRAYLLTAVRRLHVDKLRGQAKLTTSDDMSQFDPGVPFHDTAVAGFESGAAAKAFASLPERWQLVLWHLEVEGHKPADIAPLLGMSANSVSALAYRAREGLRQAFLTAHLADTSDEDCRWVNEHLGAYVREGLSKRDNAKVKAHLDDCRKCTAMYLELTEVNSNLSAIITPLLLGSAAAGYLSTTGAGAGATGGVVAFFDRAKDTVVGNVTTVAAGAAAATVAAVVVVTVALAGGEESPTARPPQPSTSQPAVPADTTPPAEPNKPKKQRKQETPASRAVVPPPVVNVADPAPGPEATPAPPGEVTPTADIAVASVSISDDAVVLDIDGLPADQVVVDVDLESESGRTTFEPGKRACSVREADKRHAACVTGSGSGGAAVLLLAPSRFQAVIPLDYPASMESDELTVSVSVRGYDDPATGNNTARLTFTPERDAPSSPPSSSPSETPTTPGPTTPGPTTPTPTTPDPTTPTPTTPTPTTPTPTTPDPTTPSPSTMTIVGDPRLTGESGKVVLPLTIEGGPDDGKITLTAKYDTAAVVFNGSDKSCADPDTSGNVICILPATSPTVTLTFTVKSHVTEDQIVTLDATALGINPPGVYEAQERKVNIGDGLGNRDDSNNGGLVERVLRGLLP